MQPKQRPRCNNVVFVVRGEKLEGRSRLVASLDFVDKDEGVALDELDILDEQRYALVYLVGLKIPFENLLIFGVFE